MNLKSIVVIVLRLMALNFLLLAAVQLVPSVLETLRLYKQMGPENDLGVTPWLIIGGFLAGAILLWFLALPIARLVTRGVPQELSFGAMSPADSYTIIFIGLGLYYTCTYLPDVLNWSHYIFKEVATNHGTSWKEKVDFYKANQAFIPFIVGVVLLIYGRSWAVSLALKQGNAPANPIK